MVNKAFHSLVTCTVTVTVWRLAAARQDSDGERQAGRRHHQHGRARESWSDRARVTWPRPSQANVHVGQRQRPRTTSS